MTKFRHVLQIPGRARSHSSPSWTQCPLSVTVLWKYETFSAFLCSSVTTAICFTFQVFFKSLKRPPSVICDCPGSVTTWSGRLVEVCTPQKLWVRHLLYFCYIIIASEMCTKSISMIHNWADVLSEIWTCMLSTRENLSVSVLQCIISPLKFPWKRCIPFKPLAFLLRGELYSHNRIILISFSLTPSFLGIPFCMQQSSLRKLIP